MSSEVDDFQYFVFTKVCLNDVLGIPIVLHGGDNGLQHFWIVDLVVQVEKTKTNVLAIFNQDYRPFVNIPTMVDDEHVLVGVAVFV